MEEILRIIESLGIDSNVSLFDISISNFLMSISLLFLFILFKKFIKNVIIKKITLLLRFSDKKIKGTFIKSIDKPINFLVILLGIVSATNILNAPDKISGFFDNVNLSLFTILIFWLISKCVSPLTQKIQNLKLIFTNDLLDWFVSAIKILIYILGFSAVLELWGIRVGPIIAGLGLFGVAVALGAQDLFKNLISGILVLVEKRFKKGDVIFIQDIVEGSVEKIGFRSTAVRKFDKSLCFIPNYQFAENAVTNITEISNRRINWIIGVEYKSTITQLKNICDDIEKLIIKNNSDFIVSEATPVIVKINEFSPSSIDLIVRCFTRTNDYSKFLEAKDRLAIEIKKIIERRKCSFAFPSQTIYVEK